MAQNVSSALSKMFCVRQLALLLLVWISCTEAQSEGTVRLTGTGANNTQGRVEIFHNGQWGSVCDDAFTNTDASVVCRQLGFRPETARVIANTFGQGTGPIWLDDMACTGTETRLDECPHKGWGQADCAHNEDVAVKCEVTSISPTVPAIPTTTKSPTVVQGSNCTIPDSRIRIIGPSNLPGTGVVQVLSNNQWGGVCDNDWDINDARVVCRSLCYDPAKALPGSVEFDISNITQPMTISRMNCAGTEQALVDCPQTAWVSAGGACLQSEKARVTCEEMDNSAPARPAPIIRCTNGRISASFSTITDPHLEPKHLSINMTYSGPCSEEKTNTTDFITISAPFDECGTQAETNSTHIIYKTQIRYLPTYSIGSVSHSNTYIFKVQCELPRNVDAGKPIVPITETITEKAPGQFIVGLSFYKDPKFETAETEFPLEIPLGEWLGSAVQLTDVDKNLRLVVRDCYATPSNDRHHSTNYSLFSDKCIDDNTVGFFPFNDTMFGFRYQTFKFVLYPEVHIHCNALVCRKEDVDPECDRSCLATTPVATTPAAGRRRRSANHQIIEVSGPAMIVYDPNHSGSVITRGDSTTTRRQVLPSSNITGSTSAVIKLSTTHSPSTPSSSKRPASAGSTATPSEQTIRPPYLAEFEPVISDNRSGASVTVSNISFMCLVIIAVFIFNL